MTDARNSMSPAAFYDALAEGYDAMTDFDQRTAQAERFAGDLLARSGAPVRRAVDVGCGTGAYTLALARLGLAAVGLDPSPEMVRQARRNARRLELGNARFVEGGLADIGPAEESVGAVVCMGNTLPHILADADLRQGLRAVRQALVPAGFFAVQLLNYAAILANRERIVSIDTQGGESFVRFYDFLPDGLLRFNLLRFPQAGGAHSLSGVLLRPYGRAELESFLAEAGFGRISAFGSLAFAPFDPERSETLLLVAEG